MEYIQQCPTCPLAPCILGRGHRSRGQGRQGSLCPLDTGNKDCTQGPGQEEHQRGRQKGAGGGSHANIAPRLLL